MINFVLIKGNSNYLKKDETYFNGTRILAFFHSGLVLAGKALLTKLPGFPN